MTDMQHMTLDILGLGISFLSFERIATGFLTVVTTFAL